MASPTNSAHALQLYLRDTGRYAGPIDGDIGRGSKDAILLGFQDGPDTPLNDGHFHASARRTAVDVSKIKAIAHVEAAGAGFFQGKPKILPEPHRFHKLTGGRFDASHPRCSYRKWGTRPYPASQADRYALLLEMIDLDPWAGFQAASYGKFQLLGEHFATCGYPTPWHFAFAQAVDEETQLMCFEAFIKANGIVQPLRAGRWAEVARRYNGPAYAKNQYDVKLAQAEHRFRQQAQL